MSHARVDSTWRRSFHVSSLRLVLMSAGTLTLRMKRILVQQRD